MERRGGRSEGEGGMYTYATTLAREHTYSVAFGLLFVNRREVGPAKS